VYKVEMEISGQPQGKGRPRFTKTGKAYTPDKTKEYESRIQAAAWKAMQEAKLEPTERFVAVDIIAFMEIPKSWPTVKRMEAEYGALQHTTKPDLDNIIKAAVDGISSGNIIMDDKQVTSIKAKKMYCHPDRGAVLYISVSWTDPEM
tara:strand:+ start:1638 stop:2078 length:441 start_codon:yes stop_codon:yes gene_type:complete